MPCRDDRDDPRYQVFEYIKRCDELTRMLCIACVHMRNIGIDIPLSINGWWASHQLIDEARIRAEAAAAQIQKETEEARQSALAKLTLAERKALGIK